MKVLIDGNVVACANPVTGTAECVNLFGSRVAIPESTPFRCKVIVLLTEQRCGDSLSADS